MGDSDQDNKTAVPEWQKPKPAPETESPSSSAPSEPPATVEQARKFLQDDEVRRYPREKKIDFLKSKGLSEPDIQQLLSEETETPSESPQQSPQQPTPQATPQPQPQTETQSPISDPTTLPTPPRSTPPPPEFQSSASPSSSDQPPIVTYPEFLTKPIRPPPLITANRFLTTLYSFAGVASLLYGGSKYLVAPMVENLTSARIEFHEQAKDDLERLVDKLEGCVSEIPPYASKTGKGGQGDDGQEEDVDDDEKRSQSEYDDPTELFHRDIGVQTSPPRSPVLSPSSNNSNTASSTTDLQLRSLTRLTSSLREVERGFAGHKDGYEDVRAVLGVFKDELDELRYPTHDFGAGGGGLYGYGGVGAGSREPDDEIRKMKEGIRRVKGVLLSARSFPVAGR